MWSIWTGFVAWEPAGRDLSIHPSIALFPSHMYIYIYTHTHIHTYNNYLGTAKSTPTSIQGRSLEQQRAALTGKTPVMFSNRGWASSRVKRFPKTRLEVLQAPGMIDIRRSNTEVSRRCAWNLLGPFLQVRSCAVQACCEEPSCESLAPFACVPMT